MKSFVVTVLCFFALGCKNKTEIASERSDVYYTCSMHPEVKESKPGLCPVCKMELIAVKAGSDQLKDELELSPEQIQLGNIQTDTIHKNPMSTEIVLPATLNFDQLKTNAISARVMGRIEKLYFKNIGEYVKKGSRLFDIYSEELNNAKQEYLLVTAKQKALGNTIVDFTHLVQSAKNKLQLWGMSESQLQALDTNVSASPLTSFYSNVDGFITSIDIKEGEYVSEGSTLLRLANLSSLWAEAQIYSSQLSSIDAGGRAIVRFTDIPGKEISGKIEFVNPEINNGTRINLLRVTIPNAGNQLKPGMQAYVVITNHRYNSLTLPSDAVIRDGRGASVWIKIKDNKFKYKMIEIGDEGRGRVEIRSGLQDGDVVVTSGAYLLNSEYIFTVGSSPMQGMKM